MNQQQAIAKLRKMLGPKMAARVNEKALPGEKRAEESRKVPALQARTRELEAALHARRAELLADPAYQALKAELEAARNAADLTRHRAAQKRITVGVNSALFFHVRAEADTWAEVVAIVEAEQQKQERVA
jgi:hypothetical protein